MKAKALTKEELDAYFEMEPPAFEFRHSAPIVASLVTHPGVTRGVVEAVLESRYECKTTALFAIAFAIGIHFADRRRDLAELEAIAVAGEPK